jgi:hypothetical protein
VANASQVLPNGAAVRNARSFATICRAICSFDIAASQVRRNRTSSAHKRDLRTQRMANRAHQWSQSNLSASLMMGRPNVLAILSLMTDCSTRGPQASSSKIIIFERYANAKYAGPRSSQPIANGKHVSHSGARSFGCVASRRCVLRVLTSSASALALCGCASMALEGPRFDAFVATTRKLANGARAKPWFGPERASSRSRH